jgi:RNA polymerase-binding transcription factor DksA
MAKTKKVQKKTSAKKAAPKKAVKKVVKKAAPAKKAAVKKASAVKKAVKKTSTKKAVAKKTSVKPAAKKTVKKAAVKKAVAVKKTAAPAPKAKPIAKVVATPVKKTVVSSTNTSTIKTQTPLMEASKNNESLKTKYSEEDLKEFEELINDKLDRARKELKYIKESLSRKNDESSDNSNSNLKLLEDGADTLEKESFSQLAARQMKFIQQLEFAIARIKNGTYGVCIETGKLIPKERLRAVPHTQHSIEAKLNRR